MVEANADTQTAKERWDALRIAAGFSSDRELERTAGLTQGTISAWTTTAKFRRDGSAGSYRVLKGILKISMDLLDELILGMRDEKSQAAQVIPSSMVSD